MNKSVSAKTLADELSSDVATAILTRQGDPGRDPLELLEIVRTVHLTLQELSSRTRDRRLARLDRLPEIIELATDDDPVSH